MTDTREFNLWVLLYPAPDLPGTWIAHCLDIDAITQGSSLVHAAEMIREAVDMLLHDDLKRGRDPMARNRAPEADWKELQRLLQEGNPSDLRWFKGPGAAHAGTIIAAAFQLRTAVTRPMTASRRAVRALRPAWSRQAQV